METKKYTISILGCGWYGLAMGGCLVKNGHTVKGSTTSENKLALLEKAGIQPYLLNLTDDTATVAADFFKSELLIIALPPKKLTTEKQAYDKCIERIAALATADDVKQVIFISSTSVYKDSCDLVDEYTRPHASTSSAEGILAAEHLLFMNNGFVTTVIRFAGLVGPERAPGRFFAGKKDIPNGKAPINLIHLDDCLGITLAIIELSAFGNIYNACCPHHPEKQDFYTRATLNIGLPVPAFKDELLTWKKISSVRISENLNYQWKVGNWDEWLEAEK
ncbi:NAD(P)H-binding protein [Pedobacter sp. MC2016-14]|uniref:NAD(P)H-binding protein n=1 Tax=Pedobacter sp. MC2016-14 TaxID=2897327 RepID=UPI001E3A6E9B|nr:NAD(P)H-binding protein [Pedobacter sp. MC2016-14]MCD0490231.1 NAD(P)H-binding protein [Pedobacter sp. MC2016-14]